MAKTVVGLIDNQDEAQKVVEELLRSGFERNEIGVISNEVRREVAAAVSGASRGIAYGGLAGLLAGAAALALPGVGPVLVAGPALPLLGAAFGAVAGGIIGGLKSKGVPEEDAQFLAEGVRRGGTLITIYARSDELAQRALEIMKRHGAVDLNERAAEWRRLGWGGHFMGGGLFSGQSTQPASPGQTGQTAQENLTAQPAQASAPGPAQAQAGSASVSAESQSAVPASAGAEPARPASAQSQTQGKSSAPQAGVASQPSERTEEASAQPAVALSAVAVYSIEIEMPEEIEATNQPAYEGRERRSRSEPYRGTDRRKAA
jgi:hypothetical protein